MKRHPFFTVPTLGGWLSMANAVALYGLAFAGNHGDEFGYPMIGEYLVLALSVPIGWLFIRPLGGCIDPIHSSDELFFMCFMIGANCFAWGYGLAAIHFRVASFVGRLTRRTNYMAMSD
ncbi:MAG: hypothetical protein QM775_13740 [Pirellulales bacterium]